MYFFTSFIGHFYQLVFDPDVKGNLFLLVFCSDSTTILTEFFPSSLINRLASQSFRFWRTMGLLPDIQYFRLQLLSAAPRYKPCKERHLPFLFLGTLKSLKQIWHFSAASCSLFNTLVSSVIDWCQNVACNRFASSSICPTIFSTQSSSWFIFNGWKTSPKTNMLYTHPAGGTCVLTCPVCGALAFHWVFILFIFSPYRSNIGFNMLSKSTYSIKGTLNWYWSSCNFNHYSFSEGILTFTSPLLLQYS